MAGRMAADVTELIGNTPLVRLNRVTEGCCARVAAKLEQLNPGGSVKDRAALRMLDEAAAAGLVGPGSVVVEASSGNTGIGLALCCAVRGYRCVVFLPESMSAERRRLLRALGARVEATPAAEGMAGALERAVAYAAATPNSFMPRQFANPANPAAHEAGTGEEIWRDTGGEVDAFVAGVGTAGTLTGVARCLRRHRPSVRIVAVEPAASPVLAGGRPGSHAIEGIGAGFIPEVLDMDLIDEVVPCPDEDAAAMSRALAAREGILCGISGGAAAAAAVALARRPELAGRLVVVLLPDTGERYLSTPLYEG